MHYEVRWIRSDATDKSDTRWMLVSDVGASPAHHLIRGLDNGTGYDVQVRAVTDHEGAWSATKRATPYEPASSAVSTQTAIELGLPVAAELATRSDVDVFKLTVQEDTLLLIRTSGGVRDTFCSLLDQDGAVLDNNDDGNLDPDHFQCVLVAPATHDTYPATFYVLVRSYDSRYTGSYVLNVDDGQVPGNSIATALPIALGEVKAGELKSADQTDYLRLDVGEEQYVSIQAHGEDFGGRLTLRDSTDNEVRAAVRPITRCFFLIICIQLGLTLKARLSPGVHYVTVEPAESDSLGAYYITRLIDTEYASLIARCSAETRPAGFADALSGCQ